MTLRAGFVVGIFLIAMGLGAEPRWFAPAFLKTGGVSECYGWDEAPMAGFSVVVVRVGSDKALLKTPGFRVDRPLGALGAPSHRPLQWAAALVAIDALEAPGPVVVRFVDAAGKVLAEVPSEIHPRPFPVEDIPLNAQMSELRAQPDPRKDREAAVIWEVYQTFHPQVRWPGGKFVLPVALGTPLSALYGDTRHYLYANGTDARDYHRGTDFAVPVGTPVSSAGKGTVVLAADRLLTGKTLVIEHAPGVHTVYFHLSKLLVKAGTPVDAGTPIALSGATGLVTGPHLHWEVRIGGTPVDPLDLVQDGLLDTAAVDAVVSSVERLTL